MEEQSRKSVTEIVREAFSLKDTASHSEIRQRMQDAGTVTGTNLCMMTCANIIGCIGLNAGSMVTCIGAMFLEPLMGTIMLITYSMVSADKQNLKSSSLGFLFQIAACLIASTLYFIITPVKGTTEEILSFAQPTLFEVLVAFVGGVAGVIGYTRKDRVNTIIPGVAIATALMLPLCTCGYAIANQDPRIIVGSLYMFVVNVYFITLGATIILALFNIPKYESMTDEQWAKSKRIMIINTIIIILPAIIVSIYRLLH